MSVPYKNLHLILMHGASRVIFRNKNILFLTLHFHKAKTFVMANKSSFHEGSVLLREMMFLMILLSAFSSLTATLRLFCLQSFFILSSVSALAGNLAVSSFIIYFSLALGAKLVQHVKKLFFLTLIQLKKRCDLTQAHGLIQRISQKLHYKLFSFFKIFRSFHIFSCFIFIFHFTLLSFRRKAHPCPCINAKTLLLINKRSPHPSFFCMLTQQECYQLLFCPWQIR